MVLCHLDVGIESIPKRSHGQKGHACKAELDEDHEHVRGVLGRIEKMIHGGWRRRRWRLGCSKGEREAGVALVSGDSRMELTNEW